ncbi:hypothetical protein J2TS4_37420 [Paenibacillus sp. J2TS4]|nr:hypothetical protein J2TS4_37420 [Paenibacillus sp. J2TS4]
MNGIVYCVKMNEIEQFLKEKAKNTQQQKDDPGPFGKCPYHSHSSFEISFGYKHGHNTVYEQAWAKNDYAFRFLL